MNFINYSSNGLKQFYSDPRFSGIYGQGQTIAVIDTGFNLSHTGFGIDKDNNGIKDVFRRPDLDFTTAKNSVNDGNVHGMRVAGVAFSVAPGINILPIQVSTTSQVSSAIDWITQNKERYNITTVNISLSDADNSLDSLPTRSTHYPIYTSIGEAEKKGITFVSAAGNYYQNYNRTQGSNGIAGFNNVIGVMSTNGNGLSDSLSLGDFSQRRANLTAAPGSNIPVFEGTNTYRIGAGTSFAAPFVSGSIALLQGTARRYLNRELTPLEVKNLIAQTDTPLTQTVGGYEQINAYNAADRIYNISKGIVPNTLGTGLLTNQLYLSSTIPLQNPQSLSGGNQLDALIGRSTVSNTFQKGGGVGSDLLVGGTGKNTFIYDDISQGGDEILNFVAGKDKIDVSRILKRIGYMGSNPLLEQRIRLGVADVTNTVISLDQDGAGIGQPQVLATLVNTSAGTINNLNNFIFR
jgi:subtilisin family serine protease